MFAELEVLTDRTATAILAIPSSAVVEANSKKLVYVQNGNAYQSAEVTLGQTSGDMVEVKSGLFEGDVIVTQRATQLYAQSLRGGSNASEGEHQEGEANEAPSPATDSAHNKEQLSWWLIIPVGGAIAAGTFGAGAFWASRRTKPQLAPTHAGLVYVPEGSPNGSAETINPVHKPASRVRTASENESPQWVDNHHVKSQEPGIKSHK